MSRTAFKSNNIYTGKSEEIMSGIILVEDDKIVAVGDANTIEKLIDKNTTIYDLRDSFIMPGICDFHVHLVNSATLFQDGDLRMTTSEANAAEALWELHKNSDKKDKWILAGAWDNLLWGTEEPPKKETLDKYFPDTPVFLLNKECHGAWLNSKGFGVLGIDKNTPNPKDGIIYRNDSGEPSGYIHESAVFLFQEKIFNSMSEEEISNYAKAFIKLANEYGITSIGDVAGVADVKADAYSILEKKTN